MHPVSLKAFRSLVSSELAKEASFGTQAVDFMKKHREGISHGVELAGLGVLAKPSIDELRGKKVDERTKAKREVQGLGILAAPSAFHLAHSAFKKVRP